MDKKITIQDKILGDAEQVYVIAEAGVLHFGSLENAKKLVNMALSAGADAVKFQIYKAENFISKIVSPDWFERMKSKELSYEEFAVLKKYCDDKKITFLASAHDEESFEFLARELNPPAFKIGSGEIQNYEYIEKVASKGKPVILSTGMYTIDQIKRAIKSVVKTGNRKLVLLHCVTLYPAGPEKINLKTICTLKKLGFPVGYSDHTIGFHIPLAAVGMGACIIEKHISLDKNVPGSQDCQVSCDEKELMDMVRQIREIKQAMGDGTKKISGEEKKSMEWARKSIVASSPISTNSRLTRDMLCFKRPGTGLPPEVLKRIIGKTTKRAIQKDEMISMEDLK